MTDPPSHEYLTPEEVEKWALTCDAMTRYLNEIRRRTPRESLRAATLREYAEIVEAVATGGAIQDCLYLRARKARGYEQA